MVTRKHSWLLSIVWVLLAASAQFAWSAEKPASDGSGDRLGALITDIVRQHIPHHYEDRKKWGLKTRRFDGLKISLDGLRVKTKRRYRQVNHGNWYLYRLRLSNPHDPFQTDVANVRTSPDGRVEFDLSFTADIAAFARTSKWYQGVQLYSFSADADAKVRLQLHCLLGLKLDPLKTPPDVALDPHVSDARLELLDFRLRRISNLRGAPVKELSNGARRILEDKIEEKRGKITAKINAQIDRQRDKMRISLQDLLSSKWSQLSKHIRRDKSEKESAESGRLDEKKTFGD